MFSGGRGESRSAAADPAYTLPVAALHINETQARALAHALSTIPLAQPRQPGAALGPADLRAAPTFSATVLEYCSIAKKASGGATCLGRHQYRGAQVAYRCSPAN